MSIDPVIATKLDSLQPGATAFFTRQLQQIDQRLLERKTPPLNGMRRFPLYPGIDPNAASFVRRMGEVTGTPKFKAEAGDDLPLVAFGAIEDEVKLHEMVLGFDYTAEDIARAAFTGLDLSTEKARGALQRIEERRNQIIWHGHPALNLYGVLTHPLVGRYALGVSGSAAIGVIQPAIVDAINSIADDSDDTHKAEEVLIASRVYRYLAGLYTAGDVSKNALQLISESVDIDMGRINPCHELNGAGPGGTDAMVIYSRDPDVCGIVLPKPAAQGTPKEVGHWRIEVPMVETCGGVICNYPGGMKIASFTDAR